MEHVVHFGSKEIRFQLHYNGRKTLGITVTPELEVRVTAPAGASLEKIKEKILKRAPWIMRQEDFFLRFHPRTPARRFVSGETHLFLGRQYRLKLQPGKKNLVHRLRNTLTVTLRPGSKASKVLHAWYRQQAQLLFPEITEGLLEKFSKYKIKPTGIYLQQMPTRWGSCTPRGKVILNPELIKAPRRCIEYVIIHELCHLVHHGHTRKFFDLQRQIMPDWEKWKEKLERELN